MHGVTEAALIKREMVDLRAAPGISHLISPPSIPPVSPFFQSMEAAASAPDWRGEFLIKFALRVIRRAVAAVETGCFQRGAFYQRLCFVFLNPFGVYYISVFKKEPSH